MKYWLVRQLLNLYYMKIEWFFLQIMGLWPLQAASKFKISKYLNPYTCKLKYLWIQNLKRQNQEIHGQKRNIIMNMVEYEYGSMVENIYN
jgi:hypothetical protein